MSYSTIPKSKQGQCTQCGNIGAAVKVKKDLFCLSCHQTNKNFASIKKAKDKAALPSIVSKLRNNHGNLQNNDIEVGRQQLIQDLDWTFSRWIRILYAIPDGRVKCYTCSTTKKWEQMQCGHFVSRSHLGLRWGFDNSKPQCPHCNCQLHGNIEEYRINLEAESKGLPDRLIEQSRLVEKPSIDEMKQLLVDLRAKLKSAEQKLIK